MSRRDEFIEMMAPLAVEIGRRYGLDPRLIISQAAQETGWGQHVPGGNLFGIKSHGQPGGQNLSTTEYVNGRPVTVNANFRAYDSVRDSMEGYAQFLRDNPRYADVFRQNNFEDQAKAVAAAGYATDPNYADALISIGRGLDLSKYGGSALDAIDQVAPRTASHNAISYGPALGQVPLSELPRPRPDPRGTITDPTAHNLRVIKTAARPWAEVSYPVEQASIHPDPRIAFHPTTFDQRFTAPKPVDRPTRNELEADRLTVVPGRSVGFSPAPNFPTGPARTGMPNADMPRRILSTDKPKTPLSRRNETRAEQQVALPPKRTAQPSQTQTNTRVAPTVQTAGYTRMPDAEFDRISRQMRQASQAEGLGTYPTKMALDDFSPPRPTAPAPAPAPVTRRNEMAAEAQMALPPKQVAPVPSPPIRRGDPLAHITPDPQPIVVSPANPAPMTSGVATALANAIADPIITFQPLEVQGRPQQRAPEPERVPGLNKYGRQFNHATKRFETPGQRDLSKVGFTMKRPTGTIFAAR